MRTTQEGDRETIILIGEKINTGRTDMGSDNALCSTDKKNVHPTGEREAMTVIEIALTDMVLTTTSTYPTNSGMSDQHNLSLATFNCYGYKSSSSYCNELFSTNDVTFLCETWLTVSECKHVHKSLEKSHWTSLKSSMDPTRTNVGRPYGGVGFICRKMQDICYSEVDMKHPRLHCVKLSNGKTTIMYVLGIYMPFNDNRSESLSEFIEILDIITSHLETVSAPTILMGDWNTSLPQRKSLSETWYRAKPMNVRSLLLYDFVCTQELAVANFARNQKINHTYIKGNQKSYIDHILVPRRLLPDMTQCEIKQHMDNASDHYAIVSSFMINIVPSSLSYESNHTFPHTRWSDGVFCDQYRIKLQNKLDCIDVINPDLIRDQDARQTIDSLDRVLSTAMHSAVEECQAKQGVSKGKHWWTTECTLAKSRNRFWYKLWVENDKPSHGVIFECYKESKKYFRKACRNAQTNHINTQYRAVSSYFRHRNTNKLWAAVKQLKNSNQDIQVSKCEIREFLQHKFDDPNSRMNTNASEKVRSHFNASAVDKKFMFPAALVIKYIAKLKSAAAPGINGITPKHLKEAVGTNLPLHLSALLTLCCRHSFVPESFTQGIIVPLPKSGKDPTTPQGYRPVTISVAASKLLEYFVLEQCQDQVHNPLMFGFIPERGTDIAVALAHDVCQHSLALGSSIHLASLDAEGAFDYIPHNILLSKAIHVLPTLSWKVMANWYGRLQARLKIGYHLDSATIPIRRGMRQGALTSPMLFNIFYKHLIDTIGEHEAGVVIDNHKYNIFNFADDVLLASTTVTGLQRLLDIAAATIRDEGLRFNPEKSVCSTFGPCPYNKEPTWTIEGVELKNHPTIKYLGITLGANGSKTHAQERVRAAQRNFYALQSVGLHKDGLTPHTAGFLHKTVITPTLMYGTSAIYMHKNDVQELYRCQGNLIKTNLGLYRSSHTSPILQAFTMHSAITLVQKNTVSLLQRCLKSDSAARTFYSHLLHANKLSSKTLVARAKSICNKMNVNILRVAFIENSTSIVSYNNVNDGLLDSVNHCLHDFNHENRAMLQLLVNSH